MLVLEQTVIAEYTLTQVLEKIREPVDLYNKDGPEYLAFPPNMDRSSINYAREQLVRASQPKSGSDTAQSSVSYTEVWLGNVCKYKTDSDGRLVCSSDFG